MSQPTSKICRGKNCGRKIYQDRTLAVAYVRNQCSACYDRELNESGRKPTDDTLNQTAAIKPLPPEWYKSRS